MRKISLYISLFVLLFTHGYAQNLQVHTYQAIDGLPSELVKGVAKDNLGFIWAATDNGLVRFDGTSYEHVLEGLPNKYVKGIIKRSDGHLLASTDLGVVEIFSRPDSVSAQVLFAGSSHKTDSLLWYPKGFYEDDKQDLWFSDNHAIFRVKNGTKTLERYPMPEYVQPNSYNRSFSFTEDGKGQLFAFSETGHFFHFDKNSNAFEELPFYSAIVNVHCAISPQDGQVWVSTNLGVLQYTSTDEGKLEDRKLVIPNVDIADMAKINNSTIWGASWWNKGLLEINLKAPSRYRKITQYPFAGAGQLLADDGQYWFATDNGLVLMKERLFTTKYTKCANTYIQHVVEGENMVYFTDGNKVFEIDNSSSSSTCKIIHRSKQGTILRICPTKDGLWLADTEGFLSLVKDQKVIKTVDLREYGKTIFILEEDEQGNLWVCQDGLDGVAKVNVQEDDITVYLEDFKSKIIVIRKGADNRLYLGGTSDKSYLYRYDDANDSFENLSLPFSFDHNVDISIEDIVMDGSSIWLGTKFGLLKVQNKTIERVDLGELTTEAVKSLALGKQGEIWIANSNGLLKYHKNNTLVFDEKNGLPNKVIGYRCLMTDAKNQVWVGTANGVGFNANVERAQKTATPLLNYIESRGVKINHQKHEFTDNDYLRVAVVSTEYPSEFVSYEYRVLGVKPDWIHMGRDKEVFLTNLPKGAYELQIRVKQQGNYMWSDALNYPFTIYVVWYRTIWGGLLIILGIVGLVALGIKLNAKRLHKEKQKLEQLVATRTKEVVEKRNEILAQNEELEQQRQELEATLEHLQTTQTQLIQAEKMSSIGELTAGVAHEINNPLNFVVAGAHTLVDLIQDLNDILDQYTKAEEAGDEEEKQKLWAEAVALKEELVLDEVREDIENVLVDIQNGASRTVSIVKTLQNFSQFERGDSQLTDLNEGIHATLILLNNRMADKVIVEKDLDELPKINCKAGLMNQVYMNLVINAIEAMDGEGSLYITSKNLEDSIEISFRDTGKGMDIETKKHIFESFFTTNESGGNRGLGLSTAKEIITDHQGTIEVMSEPNMGTTFTITIPKVFQ